MFRLVEIEPARKLGQPFLFLVVPPEHDDTLAADADIRSDDGTKRGARLPKLEANKNLLLHRQPKPAILDRDQQAEEPELPQIAHHVVRHQIVPRDFVFQRHKPLADKAADRGNQLIAGFDVERHDKS